MNNKPLFSIIIPVYNVEKYLERCIQSVLGQTFTKFELILVNDGSKDNSLAICEQFAKEDNRIKLFSQENKGVSEARNKGISIANGEYLTFIDSDDFLDTDYLSQFANKLSERDFDFVVAGVRHTDEKNNTLKEFNSADIESNSKNEIGKLIPFMEKNSLLGGPVAKTFKAHLIKENKLQFYPKFHFGEDQIFNIQYLMLCSSVAVIDYIGYNYIQREGDSLVKRKYSYEDTNDIADALFNVRLEAIKYFNIDDKEYIALNKRKYTLLKVGGLLRNYYERFKKPKYDRFICIKDILNEIDVSDIPNTSMHYKVLKFILRMKSVKMIDNSLYYYTKLKSM